MSKDKDHLLHEIDRDIEKLEKKVSKCQADFTHAQKKLQKANTDLSVALSYRKFKFGSNGKEEFDVVSSRVTSSGSSSSISSSVGGRPSPVRDAVYTALGKNNKPMRFKDIYFDVNKTIKNIGKNNVWLAISRMKDKGLVKKVSAGTYELVAGAKK